MRSESELRKVIKNCEDFQKYYKDLVEYLDIKNTELPNGVVKRLSYNWKNEINEVQVGLDNMSQVLIEQCHIYKYCEWETAMFSYLRFLIDEADNISEKEIYERIDKTWRGNEFHFDTLKNRNEYVTMEGYARLQFPWIVRLAMSDRSIIICLIYLFIVLNFFVSEYLFGDLWGSSCVGVCVVPPIISQIYLVSFKGRKNCNFILLRVALFFMLCCLLCANYLILVECSKFNYYTFIHRYIKSLLFILPVIPVDIANICNFWRKSFF